MLTEIKITPLAIMKKHQIGSCLVSIGPREKVWFNDPPQFWVKESICVNGIQISPLTLRKNTKMGLAWCLLVLEKKCELMTPHNQNFTFGH